MGNHKVLVSEIMMEIMNYLEIVKNLAVLYNNLAVSYNTVLYRTLEYITILTVP